MFDAKVLMNKNEYAYKLTVRGYGNPGEFMNGGTGVCIDDDSVLCVWIEVREGVRNLSSRGSVGGKSNHLHHIGPI